MNKQLFMGSIRMLANAIDEKDTYTRGHSERVAFYSARIAADAPYPNPRKVEYAPVLELLRHAYEGVRP